MTLSHLAGRPRPSPWSKFLLLGSSARASLFPRSLKSSIQAPQHYIHLSLLVEKTIKRGLVLGKKFPKLNSQLLPCHQVPLQGSNPPDQSCPQELRDDKTILQSTLVNTVAYTHTWLTLEIYLVHVSDCVFHFICLELTEITTCSSLYLKENSTSA